MIRCSLWYCPNRHGPLWEGMKKPSWPGPPPARGASSGSCPSCRSWGSTPARRCTSGPTPGLPRPAWAGPPPGCRRPGRRRPAGGRRRSCRGSRGSGRAMGRPGNWKPALGTLGRGLAPHLAPQAVQEGLAAGDQARVGAVLVHLELQVRLAPHLLPHVVGQEGVRAAAEVGRGTRRAAAGPPPPGGRRPGSSGRWASTSCRSPRAPRASSPAAAGSPAGWAARPGR